MTPAEIFNLANTVALVVWLALIIARFVPPLRRWVDPAAGYVVPALFAVVYIWLLGPGALDVLKNGSFNSLAGVGALFAQPGALLGGWIHYLAFDLFVGGWIAREGSALKISAFILTPILLLTFLFGPAGYLVFVLFRLAVRRNVQ
jgi:hypothetical protein